MAEKPEDLLLQYPHRIETKAGRVGDDIGDFKVCMTSVEAHVGIYRRIDRLGFRGERVERRHELVELPH